MTVVLGVLRVVVVVVVIAVLVVVVLVLMAVVVAEVVVVVVVGASPLAAWLPLLSVLPRSYVCTLHRFRPY